MEDQLANDIVSTVSEAASREVPWFLAQMPSAYFRQVNTERQRRHLRAITALTAEGISTPEVQLNDGDATTFISSVSDDETNLIDRQLLALPRDRSLRRVLLFASRDGRLNINVFETAVEEEPPFCTSAGEMTAEERAARARLAEYQARLAADELVGVAGHVSPTADVMDERALEAFLRRCPSSYVCSQIPRLLFNQMQLFYRVVGTDDVAVSLEHEYVEEKATATEKDDARALLTAVLPDTAPRAAIKRIRTMLAKHGMEMLRAQVDTLSVDADDKAAGKVTLLRTVVRPKADVSAKLEPREVAALGERLVADVEKLKWVDDRAQRLAASTSMDLLTAEVACGLSDLSLALLDHPLLSRDHVHHLLSTDDVQPPAAALASLLLGRFDPRRPMAEEAFEAALTETMTKMESSVGDEQSRELLRAMGSCVRHTLRTNAHLPGRWALALRLQPELFAKVLPPKPPLLSNMPYGIYFLAGRHFNGYHVRFANISRGGLRVVYPPNKDAYKMESRRHFQECYGLAWAQQLKNKDIPEGGAKGVCLVRPVRGEDRASLLHACVKKMADGILDLISPASSGQLVTRTMREHPPPLTPLDRELLFLGPDENIVPSDIDWLVERAAHRGYAMPSAFISSKPRAGINHKEYGVTSEGVAVFLHEALQAVGISPTTQPFSVKLTGGPDGDVAGNMLRILHRDYGDNVRVVGLADGTGSAEDPAGLPMAELMRMVDASLPLDQLDTARLGPTGRLTLANTAEGVATRNSMHNRVVADAFVPAGGRPATMNASNWRDFLQPDGAPSAKVIVEGANLFLTPEARLSLFEEVRLPVVKDSSANKCGVVCSSLEIISSMVCTANEFVAFKAEYVEQVLQRLRELARLEASLLFRESARDASVPLPALSERISTSILRVDHELGALLDGFSQEQQHRLWPLVAAQLPPAFAAAGYSKRLPETLPWEYQKSAITAGLASRLVYREGLSFVEELPAASLPKFALAYLQQEQHVRALANEVRASGARFAPEVESLLLRGGVRVAAEAATSTSDATVVDVTLSGEVTPSSFSDAKL